MNEEEKGWFFGKSIIEERTDNKIERATMEDIMGLF